MGSIIDKNFIKRTNKEIVNKPGLIPHLFHLLILNKSRIAIMKNDSLIHYSVDSFKKYLGKITSRVINNIFTSAKEGFRGRDEIANNSMRYKKYLFLPNSFSLIFPIYDSLYLVLTRRNIGYFIHLPLCLFTSSLILYYQTLKLCRYQPVFKSYGETKPVRV